MRAEALPDTLYGRLAEFIAAKTGLSFAPERRADLQRCMVEAAAEFGFADISTCAHWLLSSPLTPAQLNTLATHLTIGETYFFREKKVFDALVGSVLPGLIQRRRERDRRLRLWSAACSTGEEAYSLAIALDRLLPDWSDWQVTLLATDINTRSLRRAVAGAYGEWSFRESEPGFKERYFTLTADRRFAVVPPIRQRVTFAQLNLADDDFPSHARAMDVILCRNLLMYFTPTHARKLVGKLCDALSEGGWLAVSPSECSQSLFSQFTAVNFPGAILYQKGPMKTTWSATVQSRTEDAPPVADTGIQREVAPAVPLQASPPTLAADVGVPHEADSKVPAETSAPCTIADDLFKQGRYPEVIDALLSLDQAELEPPLLSLLARAFANQGKLGDALEWSRRWIAADKLDAGAHYVHAMILMELGERSAARDSLQRVVYLQPDFVLAHLALGNCARGDARSAEANRHFTTALRLARARPADEPLPESEGLTAGRLTQIIAALTSEDSLADDQRNARA